MGTQKGAKFWNNGERNCRSINCPGPEWVPGRIPFKRKPPTEETRNKIAEANKGKPSPMKGKKFTDPEILKKYSEAAKLRNEKYGPTSGAFKKGSDPWNKGLSAESDDRVAQYAEKQRGQIRDIPPRADYDVEEFKGYKDKVWNLTNKLYRRHADIINPENLPRGIAKKGTDNYQLDHIVPVLWGFRNGIPAEKIGSMKNLRMIHWEENLCRPKRELDEDAKATLKLL